MILDYEPGDKVTNPNNKEWGIGQVQSIINDKVTVNFENAGKKVINAKNIELKNGKELNLGASIIKNTGQIKFISYSNKIKPEIQKIYDELGVTENIKMKSSLKFCVVATGEYDGYVAEPRAYEWDIAAGHAILNHAGGKISDFDGNEILYGKPDLKNTSLILKIKLKF